MEVFNPANMRELAADLSRLAPGAVVAGGCTDLSVRFLREPKPEQLLNISLVRELRKISAENGFLRVGAAAAIAELEAFPLPESLAALKQAAAGIGSKQIRSAATVGGNIMNASPAGDLQPCAFMFGAVAEYMRPDGSVCERPIEEVVVGAGKTSLAYNEALTALRIPIPPAGVRSAFWKLGFRKTVTIARVNIALSVSGREGKPDDVRFFLGAVAPVPARIREAEEILLRNEWDDITFETLAAYLSAWLKRAVPAEFDRDYKALAIKGAVFDVMRAMAF